MTGQLDFESIKPKLPRRQLLFIAWGINLSPQSPQKHPRFSFS